MLNIKTTDNNLLLPEKIKVAITEVNPILVRDKGSNSLSFAIPFQNNAFLGNPHRADLKRMDSEDVNLSFNSMKRSCSLKYQQLNKQQYNCNLIISSFNYLHGDKSIRELTLGGSRDYADYPSQPNLFRFNSDISDYVFFQVANSGFMDGTMYETSYKATNGCQNDNDAVDFFHEKTPRTPFIYLCYLYENIFIENGYQITENYLRDNEHLKRLVLYTNQSIKGSNTIFKLPYHLPDIKISEFINAISDLLNIHPLINESNKTVRIISYEEKIRLCSVIDVTKHCNDDLTKKGDDIPTKFIFKISANSSDELQAKHVILSEEEDITIKEPVATKANLPTWPDVKDVRLVIDENMFYRREIDGDGLETWEQFSINLQPVTVGDGDTEENINSSANVVQGQYNANNFLKVEMPGNSATKMNNEEIPFMLAFAIPGTGTLHNNSGVTDPLFLTAESIFEKHWKTTANKRITSFQPFECTIEFPLDILNELDYCQQYKIQSSLFEIEEIKYNLENDKVKYGKSKLRAF